MFCKGEEPFSDNVPGDKKKIIGISTPLAEELLFLFSFFVFNATFNNISVISWLLSFIGGGNQSTRRSAQVVVDPTTIRS